MYEWKFLRLKPDSEVERYSTRCSSDLLGVTQCALKQLSPYFSVYKNRLKYGGLKE